MKHNSLADFTNKVTSKDLLNIPKIRITCVTLFGKVTLFPFVSVLKAVCPFWQKAKRCQIPHAKSKKSAKIHMFCMQLSDTFLHLAKGTLIALWAVAKGNLLPVGSLCMRNPRIACNADHVLQYTAQINQKSKYKNGDDI